MIMLAGVLAAVICAVLFASAIWCFLRCFEGPIQEEKVYSVDKRPALVRVRAYLRDLL